MKTFDEFDVKIDSKNSGKNKLLPFILPRVPENEERSKLEKKMQTAKFVISMAIPMIMMISSGKVKCAANNTDFLSNKFSQSQLKDKKSEDLLKTVDEKEINNILENGKQLNFVDDGKETLLIIDNNHLLSPDTRVKDPVLVSAKNTFIPALKSINLSQKVYTAAKDLFKGVKDEMAKEGKTSGLRLASGSRPYNEQKWLFNDKKARVRKAYPEIKDEKEIERIAEISVAKPGTSEHNSAHPAIDLTTQAMVNKYYSIPESNVALREEYHYLMPRFEDTPEGKVVKRIAYKYGFDVSFKKGKEQESGHTYEPWHLYYRGLHAEILHKTNMVIQEYWQYMAKEKNVIFQSETGKTYYIKYDAEKQTIETFEIADKK